MLICNMLAHVNNMSPLSLKKTHSIHKSLYCIISSRIVIHYIYPSVIYYYYLFVVIIIQESIRGSTFKTGLTLYEADFLQVPVLHFV